MTTTEIIPIIIEMLIRYPKNLSILGPVWNPSIILVKIYNMSDPNMVIAQHKLISK